MFRVVWEECTHVSHIELLVEVDWDDGVEAPVSYGSKVGCVDDGSFDIPAVTAERKVAAST